jgi:hypothetical protein
VSSAIITGRDIQGRRTLSITRLAEYDYFLVDNDRVSDLYTYMQPGSSVFVANQDVLLTMPEAWLPQLISGGGVYISMYYDPPFASNDGDGRDRILDLIEEYGSYRMIGTGKERGTNVSIFEVSN